MRNYPKYIKNTLHREGVGGSPMKIKITLLNIEIQSDPKKNGSAPRKTQAQSQSINNNNVIKITHK